MPTGSDEERERRRQLFGRPLRRLVESAGLDVGEVARRSGVSKSSLYAWFSGVTLPTVRTLDLVLLHCDPDRRLRHRILEIHEQLREADGPGRTGAGPASAPHRTAPPPETVTGRSMGVSPPPARPFVGRDDLLLEVRARLRDEHRVVLEGPGGIGKTSLALEFVNRFGRFHDVVVWVDGAEASLVDGQLARAAVELGIATADGSPGYAASVLRAGARARDGWLVVLDEADDASWAALDLVDARCAVLLCSRGAPTALTERVVAVGQLASEDALAMLRLCTRRLDDASLHRLAEHTDGLPLAIKQAMSVLEQSGMEVRHYLDVLDRHVADALEAGVPDGYPVSVSAAVRMGLEGAGAVDPRAPALLALLATLARDPVPSTWTSAVDPGTGAAGWDPQAASACCDLLVSLGLVARTTDTLAVHRLTARLVLERVGAGVRSTARERAADLLAAVAPGSPAERPQDWAALLPHVLALAPHETPGHTGLRHVAMKAAWSTSIWGDGSVGLEVVVPLRAALAEHLGPADPDALQAGHVEAWLLAVRGRWHEAYRAGAHVYRRRLEVLGERDPATLSSGGNLATFLHKLGHPAAGAVLAGRMASTASVVYGDDHPYYWTMISQRAICEGAAGDLAAAEAGLCAVVEHLGRLHGHDHPATLAHRSNLAEVHRRQGRPAEALHEVVEVLGRSVATLGPMHPDVLASLVWAGRALADLPHGGRAGLDLLVFARNRRTEVLGPGHPLVEEVDTEIARLADLLGVAARPV